MRANFAPLSQRGYEDARRRGRKTGAIWLRTAN
jgi:hypothetical protein